MSDFDIKAAWISNSGESPVDVTLCRVLIELADRVVTRYSSDFDETRDELEIPAFFLAEWISENWWPLLWEPRKSDDVADSADFLARHSMLTAQAGFALPRILIVPTGDNIHVSASARDVQFAEVRFRNSSNATLGRASVESVLRKFVAKVVARVDEKTNVKTDLQELWQLVEGTGDDQALFCKCMGALGLSPYIQHTRIEARLSEAVTFLGERAALDLCLASTPENFMNTADLATRAHTASNEAKESNLQPLRGIAVSDENLRIPPWQRGVRAAKQVRSKLSISETDPSGGDQFFDVLRIDPSQRVTNSETESDGLLLPIVGAVRRQADTAHIGLLQRNLHQRRFAAARAAYAAWTSPPEDGASLLTLAVTREQQASRAFAAELMAPIAYLRSHAKNGVLSQDRVFEIASNLGIGLDVVEKQALNNGMGVRPY